ncbi:MAG TPA: response regulator, partial [Allocoleopsis sp.]
ILETEELGEIVAFENGSSLLDSLADNPDIIFLDYELPDYNGIEMVEKINAFKPGSLIVVLSAQQNMQTTITLLNNGVFDYIIKGEDDIQKIKEIKERINKIKSAIDGSDYSQSFSYLISAEKNKVRTEFAAELHDNINPLLSASKLYLDTALTNKNGWEEYIKQSKVILLSAIDEVRTFSHKMHAAGSGDNGFEKELSNFLNLLKEQKTIDFNINAQINGLNNRLPQTERKDFFLILKELVNNLIKYSNTAKAEIRIEQTPNSIFLNVKDFGKGFDTNNYKKGVGIKSITNRIERLKGTHRIISQPGEGCNWNIRIPIAS